MLREAVDDEGGHGPWLPSGLHTITPSLATMKIKDRVQWFNVVGCPATSTKNADCSERVN